MRTTKFTGYKFILSLLILFNLLTGCRSNFESRIKEKIQDDSKTHYKVLLSMKELTAFDWDKLYVFESGCKKEVMNNALGFEYPYYQENCRIFVFLKNEKIVYHEENPKTSDDLKDGDLLFADKDSLNFARFAYGNSFFQVNDKKNQQGTYYELKQIK